MGKNEWNWMIVPEKEEEAERIKGECKGMTPISDDGLYGIKYDCRRYCPKCKLADWYDLKDTEYILCLKCGHQEPL